MRIAFTDRDKICVTDGTETKRYDSEFITHYREYVQSRARTDEWKTGGSGAAFRGDAAQWNVQERVDAYINGLDWSEGKLVYCASVNGSYCVRKKSLGEKIPEEHLYSSAETEILSVRANGKKIAVSISPDAVTAKIGILQPEGSALTTYTDGDARDGNPIFYGGKLYFDSAGVGRGNDGEFRTYGASGIYAYFDGEIEECVKGGKVSYLHPCPREDGLYCIRRPAKSGKSGNIFLDILLFPWRILKAIFGFLQAFTLMFGGESLTTSGNNPAKGKKKDAGSIFVDGSRVLADKEYARNRRYKDREHGFAPQTWKLVRIAGGKEEEILSGVFDFDFTEEGNIVFTDGRHVYVFGEGKYRKLADAELCLCVRAEKREISAQEEDFFGA